MPNTVFNASTATNVTLTGGGLTATRGASATQGKAVGSDFANTGKRYIEFTLNAVTPDSNDFVGLVTAQTLSGIANVGVQMRGDGYILYTGTLGVDLGTPAASNVVCVAANLDRKLFWIRLGAAGNWNGSATANPATEIGGYPMNGAYWAPFVMMSTASHGATLNSGDTAFAGTVPSGYTAGWPVNVTSNVKLQIAPGATITDESPSAHVLTAVGNAAVSSGKVVFDGTGDAVTAPASSDFALNGSGGYTLEAYVTPDETGNWCLISQWHATDTAQCNFALVYEGGWLYWRFYEPSGGYWDVDYGWSYTTGTEYHVAVSRNASGRTRIHINGTMVKATNVTDPHVAAKTSTLSIGTLPGGSHDFQGKIRGLRLTNGECLYDTDSAITPPSLPLAVPSGSSTVLMPSQTSLETFYTAADSSLRVTQIGLEVWRASADAYGSSLFATQVALEVWASVEEIPTTPPPGAFRRRRVVILAQ